MKIKQLDLLAFGPFTDFRLDFGDTPGAVHLVYGANEAGKSSALRALTQLFYGIPARSDDAFRHPYDKLRIGATLGGNSSQEFTFTRRKGRLNTLRGADDVSIVDEKILAEMLSHVDEETFRLRFGIDSESLARGGKALVEGRGDLSESLFAAASGIAHLGKIQDRLGTESGQLFKAKGTKPLINANLRLYREAVAEMESAEMRNEVTRQDQLALLQVTADHEQIEKRIDKLEAERRIVERNLRMLPYLARRRELQAELQRARDSAQVDDEFHKRCVEAESQLDNACRQIEQLDKELARLKEQLSNHSESQSFGDVTPKLEALCKRLGEFDAATKELTELARVQQDADRQIEVLLVEVGLDPHSPQVIDAALAITDEGHHELQQLVVRKHQLDAKRDAEQHQLVQEQSRLAELDSQLPDAQEASSPVTDQAAVRELVMAVADDEDAIRRKELTQEVRNGQTEVTSRLERLSLWSGDPQQLAGLNLPEADVVQHFEQELKRANDRTSELQKRSTADRRAADESAGQLESLREQYDLPSEADVLNSRQERDGVWREVDRRWRRLDGDGQPPWSALDDEQLVDAFRDAVRQSDAIVDRLRSEAERASQFSALTEKCEQLELSCQKTSEELKKAVLEKQKLDSEWEGLWVELGVRPLSPSEMMEWRREVAGLQERMAEIKSIHARVSAVEERIVAWRSQLVGLLASEGGPELGPMSWEELFDVAQKVVQEATSPGHRKALEQQAARTRKELSQTTERVAQIDKQLTEWSQTWLAASSRLQLTALSDGRQPEVLTQLVRKLLRPVHELARCKTRNAMLKRATEQFEQEADQLRQRVGSTGANARDWVSHWLEDLTNQSVLAARVTHWRARETECLAERKASADEQAKAKALLAELCQIAGCENIEDLSLLRRESKGLSEIRGELERVNQQLQSMLDGEPVEEVAESLALATEDVFHRQLQDRKQQISELVGRREALAHERGKLTSKVEQGGQGSATLAAAQTNVECLVAGLQDDVGRYIRIQLAAHVLSEAMLRFRDKSQGPLLQRASEVFRRLTLGGFSGLLPDYDDRGEPVLVGARPGGAALTVDQMSEGTCDQLYLALRIAGLEQFVQEHAPMPLVLDDVLIKFDDQRSAAALDVFAEVAQSTQVIFFTHHEHLLELATRQLGVDQIHIHRLDGEPIKRRGSSRKRRQSSATPGQRQLF